jgi:hypothetical protein
MHLKTIVCHARVNVRLKARAPAVSVPVPASAGTSASSTGVCGNALDGAPQPADQPGARIVVQPVCG